MFSYLQQPMVFQPDAQGRQYSDSDAEQLLLIGVERVYYGAVSNPYQKETASLLHGHYNVPTELFRNSEHVFISRQALETALWSHLANPAGLQKERMALLRRLFFDVRIPYEVSYDPARSLYTFTCLVPPTPAPLPPHIA